MKLLKYSIFCVVFFILKGHCGMVGVNFDSKRDVSDSRACEQIWKKNLEMCGFFFLVGLYLILWFLFFFF